MKTAGKTLFSATVAVTHATAEIREMGATTRAAYSAAETGMMISRTIAIREAATHTGILTGHQMIG